MYGDNFYGTRSIYYPAGARPARRVLCIEDEHFIAGAL